MRWSQNRSRLSSNGDTRWDTLKGYSGGGTFRLNKTNNTLVNSQNLAGKNGAKPPRLSCQKCRCAGSVPTRGHHGRQIDHHILAIGANLEGQGLGSGRHDRTIVQAVDGG